jgi:hypothetical protein
MKRDLRCITGEGNIYFGWGNRLSQGDGRPATVVRETVIRERDAGARVMTHQLNLSRLYPSSPVCALYRRGFALTRLQSSPVC